MPADSQFDTVHALTKAGAHYGCHNRAEFKEAYWAPNGTERYGCTTRLVKFAKVPHSLSRECMHTGSGQDERCAGCLRRRQ